MLLSESPNKWITHDDSKTKDILSDIKDINKERFGKLPNTILDFMIKESENNNYTIDSLCWSLGAIARSIRSYLKENSPYEEHIIGVHFSYLGGIPELPKEEIEEFEKFLKSLGVDVDENGKFSMKELDRALDNAEAFDKMLDGEN